MFHRVTRGGRGKHDVRQDLHVQGPMGEERLVLRNALPQIGHQRGSPGEGQPAPPGGENLSLFMVRSSPITYSKSMGRPGKVANPARGKLNRENEYFPVRVRA